MTTEDQRYRIPLVLTKDLMIKQSEINLPIKQSTHGQSCTADRYRSSLRGQRD